MISLTHLKPLKSPEIISPGCVGSVGDVLINERYKSSLPGEFRWNMNNFGNKGSRLGTNTNQGDVPNFHTKSIGYRLYDTNWEDRNSFKTNIGWEIQDLRAPDKLHEPYMGAMPQYDWRNKLATVYNAKTTGDLFPIPEGGLIQGPTDGLTRGGMYPRITDVVGGLDEPPYFSPNNINTPGSALIEKPGETHFSNPKTGGRFENYKPGLSSFQPQGNELERQKRQLAMGRSLGPKRR